MAGDMPGWASSIGGQQDAGPPAPLAEVHVLVHELREGGSEVRVAFPPGTRDGEPGAKERRRRFVEVVTAEIAAAVELLA